MTVYYHIETLSSPRSPEVIMREKNDIAAFVHAYILAEEIGGVIIRTINTETGIIEMFLVNRTNNAVRIV